MDGEVKQPHKDQGMSILEEERESKGLRWGQA